MAEQIVKVRQGGTGITTAAAHGVVIGNGASAMNVTGAGTAGQVLTSNGASADPTFQSTFIGKTIVVPKATLETVTSSTTLQNDDELTFSIAANERWRGAITFPLNANSSGGFKFDITAPSGATGNCAMFGNNSYTVAWHAIGTGGGATANAINVPITITFDVTNSTNAGSITLRWAQNASFGSGTTVGNGAVLIAVRTA